MYGMDEESARSVAHKIREQMHLTYDFIKKIKLDK